MTQKLNLKYWVSSGFDILTTQWPFIRATKFRYLSPPEVLGECAAQPCRVCRR